jgi:hypothetical protein
LKDRHLGARSGNNNGRSADVASTSTIGASRGSPIALSNVSESGGLQGSLVALSPHSRAYLVSDPCYVHPTWEIAKHARETKNYV